MMPLPDPKFVFAVLGPAFLLLAAWSRWRDGGRSPRGRAWWLVGVIFCAVAAWLWWNAGFKAAVA